MPSSFTAGNNPLSSNWGSVRTIKGERGVTGAVSRAVDGGCCTEGGFARVSGAVDDRAPAVGKKTGQGTSGQQVSQSINQSVSCQARCHTEPLR